jgi:hypothetical protein
VANNDPSSRLLAVRSIFTPARRALQFLIGRVPAPAQRLGVSALQAAAARWPLLARLLGDLTSAPRAVDEGVVDPLPASPPKAPRPAAPSETTASLVAALRDPSAEAAARAAEALAQHRGEAVIVALQGVVDNRDGYYNATVRASAVRSLGRLLPPDEATSITGALGDIDAMVSLAAIATLAERDEGTSAGALMGVLEDRRGFYLPLTRQAAARALGRLHHYDRERLRGVLAAEYDDAVREALSSMAN